MYAKFEKLAAELSDDEAPPGRPRVTRLDRPTTVTIGPGGASVGATAQQQQQQQPARQAGVAAGASASVVVSQVLGASAAAATCAGACGVLMAVL